MITASNVSLRHKIYTNNSDYVMINSDMELIGVDLHLDLEQLKYVMAIVKHQHLTNASYELSISQSSLSKHLKKVEQELGGVQLFDRTTRNVTLTDAGQEFAKYASTYHCRI